MRTMSMKEEMTKIRTSKVKENHPTPGKSIFSMS